MKKAYFKIQHGRYDQMLGTLVVELFDETCPRTVRNFIELIERPRGKGYKGCNFHRIIPNFMAQCGDYEFGDGTGGSSIYGPQFDDENFVLQHSGRGILSMANSGPNTNGSQFFITFRATPHLNDKHVVFGRVVAIDGDGKEGEESAATLDALERIRTRKSDDRPLQPVTIVDCGIIEDDDVDGEKAPVNVSSAVGARVEAGGDGGEDDDDDENEIDLDDDDDDDEVDLNGEQEKKSAETAAAPAAGSAAAVVGEEEEQQKPKTKAEALKLRMRKLKLKMNQAKQLNQQAVREEGEQINQKTLMEKRAKASQKQESKQEWERQHSKALETAAKHGLTESEASSLVQQASDSVSNARRRQLKQEEQQYSMHDYHNPQGQHRNYQRSLKSLPNRNAGGGGSGNATATTGTYNPLEASSAAVGKERERQGAQRLASEMRRRIEKRKQTELKNKRRQDLDDTVSHINKRNKLFNQKISRNYQGATKEIRDNLERGTAL